jgi:dUTPase
MNENINEIPYVPKDTLKVKLSNGAQLPKYDHEDILYVKSNVNMEIPPKRIAIISTGLSIELITNILESIFNYCRWGF